MSDGYDGRKNTPNSELGRPVSGRGEPKPSIQSRQATWYSPNKLVLVWGTLGTIVGFALIYIFVLGGRT